MANKVFVQELAVQMELKNRGITLRVSRAGRLRGYLQISRGSIKWYRGREQKPCGDITFERFIDFAEEPKGRRRGASRRG